MSTPHDFISVPGAMPMLFVKPYSASIEKLVELMGQDARFQVVEVDNLVEASLQVGKLGGAISVFHLEKEEDAPSFVYFLKTSVEAIRSRRLRPLLILSFQDRALAQKLMQMGCVEILSAPVAARALLLKIERHAKLMEKQIQLTEAWKNKSVAVQGTQSDAVIPELGSQPIKPILTPLALAFIAAEIVSDRKLQLPGMAQKFCKYLSHACESRRVEFWIQLSDRWELVATHDGSPSIHENDIAPVTDKPARFTNGVCIARSGGPGVALGVALALSPVAAADEKAVEILGVGLRLLRGIEKGLRAL